MKYPTEKKCLEVLESWQNYVGTVAYSDAVCDVDCQVSSAPEMTPIEQILFFTMKTILPGYGIAVSPQHVIGKYRVDFLLEGDGRHLFGTKNILSQIVIECDGHDFHEKTKDQATRDKKRDRELQSLGFKVFRFSGSEIWKTNGQCVIESLEL